MRRLGGTYRQLTRPLETGDIIPVTESEDLLYMLAGSRPALGMDARNVPVKEAAALTDPSVRARSAALTAAKRSGEGGCAHPGPMAPDRTQSTPGPNH